MSRPASDSRIYRSDESKDPIDLPPVLTDTIYLYDPTSAVDLEPERQIAIIRSITGVRFNPTEHPEGTLPIILRALGKTDYDTLANYSELYRYLRSELDGTDRVIWITLLLQKPTLIAFNELMHLNVLKPIDDESSQDLTTARYAKLVAVEGEIEVVRALGLFNYIVNSEAVIEESRWCLPSTRSVAVAKEVISIATAEAWDIEMLFMDLNLDGFEEEISRMSIDSRGEPIALDNSKVFDRFPILQEFIESEIGSDLPDRFEQMMYWSIEYLITPMVRHLYERYNVPISRVCDHFPLDLFRISVESSREIHIVGSDVWNEVWEAFHNFNEEQLKLLLPLFPTWPIDPLGEERDRATCIRHGTTFVPKEIYYHHRIEEALLSILNFGKSPLLNLMTPELIYELFENISKKRNQDNLFDPKSARRKKALKYLDSDRRLRASIRLALLRALRCEVTHPWIVSTDTSSYSPPSS